MEKSVRNVMDLHIDECVKNLELNHFKVDVCENKQEALIVVQSYLNNGISCAVGGSVTLDQVGVIKMLEETNEINYMDRYHCEDVKKVLRESLLADVYITSSNAVTLNGELYNVDGNGNRVAAITYGPKKVIVVVGQNKLVQDLTQADLRMRYTAAPMNSMRLNKENPCAKIGHCVDCRSESRICSSYVVTKRSHEKQRIHVIIVKEDLGY